MTLSTRSHRLVSTFISQSAANSTKQTMLKLLCTFVQVQGSAFPVDIAETESVGDLKEAIKEKNSVKVKCDARALELYLAMADWKQHRDIVKGWLPAQHSAAQQLEEGETHDSIEKLTQTRPLNATWTIEEVLRDMPKPQFRQIHVLVVIPNSGASGDATTAPASSRPTMEQTLGERERRPVYLLSTCPAWKEMDVLDRTGFTYSTIDVRTRKTHLVARHEWSGRSSEVTRRDREESMAYMCKNMDGLLRHGDESARVDLSSLYLEDVSGEEDLLDCDVPSLGIMPFTVAGTADLFIVDGVIDFYLGHMRSRSKLVN